MATLGFFTRFSWITICFGAGLFLCAVNVGGALTGGPHLEGVAKTTGEQVDPAELQQRFLTLQAEYREKRAAGYDLREVNDVVAQLRSAFEKKDWSRMSDLLERTGEALARAKPPGGLHPATGEQVDPVELQQRFRKLQAEYREKRASGADMSEANPYILQLREAFEQKDWPRLSDALDKITEALAQTGAPSKPSTETQVQRDADTAESTRATAENVTESPAPHEFAFGLDYARFKNWMNIPDPPRLFSETGARWIKFTGVPWSLIEPKSEGGYRWELLDELVRSYQKYNFKIMAVLICDARWAVTVSSFEGLARGGAKTASPPKDGYWDRYAAWISAVVERYDMDGRQDMEGLREPVLDFEIESEAQHDLFWRVPKGHNPARDYEKLIKTAYEAAHNANPNARIILSGMNFGDLFDDGEDKSDDELKQLIHERFKDRRGMRELYLSSLKFIKDSLKLHRYFDAVEFHYNHDYRAGDPTMNWIRSHMARNGYSKPIWAGDALIASSRVVHSRNHSYPLGLGDKVFDALDNHRDPNHKRAWKFHMAEQASSLVKKIMVALDTGMAGIMSANEADWPSWRSHGKFWVYAGFYGQDHRELAASEKGRRPVFYTYKIVIDKLGVDKKVTERLRYADRNIFVYRVTKPDGRENLVGWYDDPDARAALESVQTPPQLFEVMDKRRSTIVDLSPYVPTTKARITRIITQLEGTNRPARPPDRIVASDAVTLSSEPVFVDVSSEK